MQKHVQAVVLVFTVAAGIATFVMLRPNTHCLLADCIQPTSSTIQLITHPNTPAEKIVNGAKLEAIRKVVYNAAYVSIAYPNGDVPRNQGACTDVVIRSLRNAGYDLQRLVHEDMKRNFSMYPQKWGLSRTDSNIDHRRVPNLMVFFSRFGRVLPTETNPRNAANWKFGDIIFWNLNGNGLTHTGIISNERNGRGLPLVIHNIGPTTKQDDCLESWRIIGHYRYPR